MSVRTRALSAAVVAAAMIAAPLAPAVALASTPTSRPAAAGGTVTVKEGRAESITGKVPAQYAKSLVVLEMYDQGVRHELGMGVADGNGNVKVKAQVGGGGSHKAQWRVVKNNKTKWTSPAFTLQIADSGKKHASTEAAYLGFQHARIKASTANPTASARSAELARLGADTGTTAPTVLTPIPEADAQYEDDGPNDDLQILNVPDTIDDSAEEGLDFASNVGSSMLEDAAGAALNGIAGGFLGNIGNMLFGALFGGPEAATYQQVQQLSNQVAEVQKTLGILENDMSTLSNQVSQVRSDVVQANVNASAATCNVLLSEANGYVGTIKNYFDDFQTVHDPAWVRANLPGKTSQQAVKVTGETIFGAGAGTPSFGGGVIELQNAVSSLAALMTNNGSTITDGVIPTCASAFSARIAAQYQAGSPTTAVPLGQIENLYYDKMGSVVSYYTTWVNVGQSVATRGEHLAVAALNNTATQADAAKLCANASPSAGSNTLSCAGIATNVQATQNAVKAAWNLGGASWSQVTNGQMAGDARADGTSTALQPAHAAWVLDIARYGSNIDPDGDNGSAPAALTSTGQISGPASGTSTLSSPNWLLGQAFTSAKQADWDHLTQSLNAAQAGQVMGQVGLANGGAAPQNLIVYTGETTQFNLNGQNPGITSWTANGYAGYSRGLNAGGYNNLVFPNFTATQGAYIDTNYAPISGYSLVAGGPRTTGISGNSVTPISGLLPYTNMTLLAQGDYGWSSPDWTTACDGCYANVAWQTTLTTSPPTGATANSDFYSPWIQTNSYETGNRQTVQWNQTTNVTQIPGFMTAPGLRSSMVPQYLWPVLKLPASGASAPCTMTSFTKGVDGSSGVGDVCSKFLTLWEAGALGITTGPVNISAGSNQATLTSSGNNLVSVMLDNSSSASQTYTMYADVTSGDAKVGSAINASSSAGNGVSISNCTTANNGVECTLVLRPGTTVLNIPVSNYSNDSVFQSVITQVNGETVNAASTVSIISPLAASTGALPGAVTGLNASADSKGNQFASLTWTVPSSNPAITSYMIVATDPGGTSTTDSVPVGQVTNGATTGGSAQYDLDLPDNAAGLWKFTVTAISPAGSGPGASTTATFGNAIPATPQNLTATEQDGSLQLDWEPVVASPALSSYNVTITRPGVGGAAGQTSTVNVALPGYTIENVDMVGQWSFSVAAVNALGTSPKASTTLAVTGIVPTRPRQVDVDVNDTGWVTVAFQASESIPAATNYFVALYEPGATTPIASVQVPVGEYSDRVRLRDFWQLGADSPTGTYKAVISPTNDIGVGQYGEGSLYVSAQHLVNVGNRTTTALFLQTYPTLLMQQAASACSGGYWTAAYQVFGNCWGGTNFTPDGRIPVPDGGKILSLPMNLTVSNLDSTSATVSWDPPPGPASDPVVGYQMWVDHNWTATNGQRSVNLTGLSSGKAHFIEVQAQHQSGKTGLISSTTINTPV